MKKLQYPEKCVVCGKWNNISFDPTSVEHLVKVKDMTCISCDCALPNLNYLGELILKHLSQEIIKKRNPDFILH